MKIKILPTQTKTKEENLIQGDVLVKMIPFDSKIKSLFFCFYNSTKSGKIPISDTNKGFKEKIDGGDIWFEYNSADKEYEIELLFSR